MPILYFVQYENLYFYLSAKKGSLTSGTLNQANLRLRKFVESVFCISWDLVLIPLCFSSVFHSNWIFFFVLLLFHHRVNEKNFLVILRLLLRHKDEALRCLEIFFYCFITKAMKKCTLTGIEGGSPWVMVCISISLQQKVTKRKVRKFQFHLKRHSSELKARHIQFPQPSFAINLSLPSVEIRTRKAHKLILDSKYAVKYRHVLFRHWQRVPYKIISFSFISFLWKWFSFNFQLLSASSFSPCL